MSHPNHAPAATELSGTDGLISAREPVSPAIRPTVLFVYEGYAHGEIHSSFGQDLLTGLVEGGQAAGVDILVATDTRDLHVTGDFGIYRDRFDAIVLSVPPRSSRLASGVQRSAIPAMIIGQRATFDIPHVFADDASGVAAAMRHLYSLGHRRIGHIAGPLHHDDALDRLSAYSTFGRANGLAMPDRWIAMGEYVYPGPEQEIERMLSLPDRPTAIFAANDEMALGVLVIANRMGLRVPEDLSIIGFDDSPASRFSQPALTTVRQPVLEMSRVCLSSLAESLRTGRRPSDNLLPTELIVRGSTGPAPANV